MARVPLLGCPPGQDGDSVHHESLEHSAGLGATKENEGEKTFYALPYRAIGDAYVKNGEFSKGRQRYWRVGLKKFPNDRGLTERVDLTAYMAGPYVEERRSWAFRQDTWKIATLIGSVAKIPAETARRGE